MMWGCPKGIRIFRSVFLFFLSYLHHNTTSYLHLRMEILNMQHSTASSQTDASIIFQHPHFPIPKIPMLFFYQTASKYYRLIHAILLSEYPSKTTWKMVVYIQLLRHTSQIYCLLLGAKDFFI